MTRIDIYNDFFTHAAKEFHKDPDKYIGILFRAVVPVKILLEIYWFFVKTGQLESIDNIEQDMKVKLWNNIKSLSPTPSANTRVDMCKVLWLLNSTL